MTDALLDAYLPLFFWVGMGSLLLRFVPDSWPKLLGRSLYWVGVPLEIFALARQTHWLPELGLAPLLTVVAVLLGLSLAWVSLQLLSWQPTELAPVVSSLRLSKIFDQPDARWQDRDRQGSFMLSSMLGNTGFVGLAVAPIFISEPYVGWLVLYSVSQNVLGTYGIGVLLASYFGRSLGENHWWVQIRDVLTVPSLWAFVSGTLLQPVPLPALVEVGLQRSIWVIIPAALLLMGMRLSQLRGWQSLQLGIVPSLIKGMLMPAILGGFTSWLPIASEARLAIVLMAGMPTAFAGLILAEEYDLDRELIASSIVLSSGLLLFTLPLWLWVFKAT